MVSSKPKALKRNNRKTILELFRTGEKISVAEISDRAELSKTTVMKIITHYIENGFIEEHGKGSSTDEGGKRPVLYRLNSRRGFVIAVQIFPTEIHSVLTDLTAKILNKRITPIRENESLSEVMDIISGNIQELIEEGGIQKDRIIGIALGNHGITDFYRGLSLFAPHFPSWGDNVNLRQKLVKRLDWKGPLYIDNQIRFQVLAEQKLGAGKGKENIVVVEAGAGLVAGIIVSNSIKRGVHGLAGEIGHTILNPQDDFQCACGGHGCFESLVSTTRLMNQVRDKLPDNPESLLAGASESGPHELTLEQVFDAVKQGDDFAKSCLDEIIKWFAIGLSNLVLTQDPDMIILHGAYSAAGNYFIEKLRKDLQSVTLKHLKKEVGLEYSPFGKEEGVIGAALFVLAEYFEKPELYEN
ncbi:MAG: ROK family transcriptional regulator [Spirochaetales bacterium]|nr:ROK family transcriptional regulator [Spirochaetales bacterium]